MSVAVLRVTRFPSSDCLWGESEGLTHFSYTQHDLERLLVGFISCSLTLIDTHDGFTSENKRQHLFRRGVSDTWFGAEGAAKIWRGEQDEAVRKVYDEASKEHGSEFRPV